MFTHAELKTSVDDDTLTNTGGGVPIAPQYELRQPRF